jgi:hypothetical protein
MQRPTPYETVYAHDRRQHRHRCQHCNRIINAGEKVLMWRFGRGGTRVLHEACADIGSFNGLTEREYAWLQSDELSRALGHKVQEFDLRDPVQRNDWRGEIARIKA